MHHCTESNADPAAASPRLQLHVFLALSLDGYIAGADGDLSWLNESAAESPADTGYEALLHEVDSILLGRTTYDTVCAMGVWPFAGKQVFVLTHRPLAPAHGEQVCSGDLADVLTTLAHRGARKVYIDGGDTVRQALALDVVHELTLSWAPIVLGGGTRLFQGGLPRLAWRLIESRSLRSGLLQGRYRRAYPCR